MSDIVFVHKDDLEFIDIIGEGGFSTVWKVNWNRKVRDSSNDSDVHCKRQSIQAAAKILNKINRQELEILSKLFHPNIVKFLGVVDEIPDFYLILELCERGTLRSYLDENTEEKLQPCLLYCWGEQCARAIKYLKEKKIVHRDVKTDNFLITLSMNLKLCDFGLAKNTDLTVTTQIKGTWGWTAPEVFKESHLSPSSDIFAFATLLWSLFTRKVPFDGESFEKVRRKIESGERLPIPPECPERIAGLMKACWDGDREKRPSLDHILNIICQLRDESRESRHTSSQEDLKNILPFTTITVRLFQQQDHLYDLFEKDAATIFSIDVCHGARVVDIKSFVLTSNCFSTKKYSLFHKDIRLEDHMTLVDYHIGECDEIDMRLDNILPVRTTEESGQDSLTESSFNGDNNPMNPASRLRSKALVTLSGRASAVAQQVREWRLVKEYKGGTKARFEFARGIAVCSNGDIVVADCKKNQVHLLSAKCVYKLTLTSPSNDTKARLEWPYDVAVTSHGHIVVVDYSKYVKLFDESGVYSKSFCTLTEDEDPDTDVCTVPVVVSSQGNILVGDIKRKLVTIHSETDGNIIGKVNVSIVPWHLAVTSNQTILVSDWAHKVVSVDMLGNTVFSIDTWLVDGEPGARPSGLTCDTEDNIYIAVYPCGYNTSHIHMYNNRGESMRCIAKGLYYPCNMTWIKGSLYVANDKSILIYSTV